MLAAAGSGGRRAKVSNPGVDGRRLKCIFLRIARIFQKRAKPFGENGGDDGLEPAASAVRGAELKDALPRVGTHLLTCPNT